MNLVRQIDWLCTTAAGVCISNYGGSATCNPPISLRAVSGQASNKSSVLIIYLDDRSDAGMKSDEEPKTVVGLPDRVSRQSESSRSEPRNTLLVAPFGPITS